MKFLGKTITFKRNETQGMQTVNLSSIPEKKYRGCSIEYPMFFETALMSDIWQITICVKGKKSFGKEIEKQKNES